MKSLSQIRKIKSYRKLQKALNDRALDLMQKYDWSHLSEIEWATIRIQDDWEKAKEKGLKEYFSGKFLIDSMGGVKDNRPSLVAVILQLRALWIEEYKLTTVPELILLDFALISYYRFLRVNWIIGNFERVTEFEFYEVENPKLKYDKHFRVTGYSSEEHIAKMVESLQPSLERFNRMFLCNLKALRDLRRTEAILNIAKIDQLNVGEKQINIRPK